MYKSSDITDFLMERLKGVNRKDLIERMKELRLAGLYPTAIRVGDKNAEPLTEEHLANVILALVSSYAALGCAERARQYGDMKYQRSATGDMEVLFTHADNNADDTEDRCFRDVLAATIKRWRREGLAAIGSLDWELTAIFARIGEPAGIVFEHTEREPGDDGNRLSLWYTYGEPDVRERKGRGVILELPGDIVALMVEFIDLVGSETA